MKNISQKARYCKQACTLDQPVILHDLDGNQAGWNATDSYQNRRMVWNEDGRLQQVTDNSGQPTTFKYDGDTNRVVKKGAGGETLYINPWYVAALGRNSKQVFAGGTRIVTKLEISPTGEGYGPGAKNLKEVAQYFYHQDHLGSTGFVTDATGEVYQHLEYFPFGETWVDEVSDDLRVPYRFTGQEFDQETRLYYHGARYYDPRTSVWQSPDPILGAYLNGKPSRGVFEPRNLALNSYAHQNPVKVTDPTGKFVKEPVEAWITADLVVPEPTDAAWPKWVAYGVVFAGAVAIDYFIVDAALKPGFATVTRNREEQNLVSSLQAQGKTANEIQSALDSLRNSGARPQVDTGDRDTGKRPPNFSPEGAGRQGAFNEAKRQNGVPTSQEPSNIRPNLDKRGNQQPGREYEFKVPGKKDPVIIRDDAAGHQYPDDPSQNRGPHFNDSAGRHYDY
jgi:RHS repeat-associated protein